jgi:predicted CoA-binding protein
MFLDKDIQNMKNMLEQEEFWNADSFVVVTDKTKPAMKLTIEELTRRGKKVYVVDLSGDPDRSAFKKVSEIPDGTGHAVIGLTKNASPEIIRDLKEKGIRKCWIHWRTETPEVKESCIKSQIPFIEGRCPMMYLSHGFSIHSIHGKVAKLLGKY